MVGAYWNGKLIFYEHLVIRPTHCKMSLDMMPWAKFRGENVTETKRRRIKCRLAKFRRKKLNILYNLDK